MVRCAQRNGRHHRHRQRGQQGACAAPIKHASSSFSQAEGPQRAAGSAGFVVERAGLEGKGRGGEGGEGGGSPPPKASITPVTSELGCHCSPRTLPRGRDAAERKPTKTHIPRYAQEKGSSSPFPRLLPVITTPSRLRAVPRRVDDWAISREDNQGYSPSSVCRSRADRLCRRAKAGDFGDARTCPAGDWRRQSDKTGTVQVSQQTKRCGWWVPRRRLGEVVRADDEP